MLNVEMTLQNRESVGVIFISLWQNASVGLPRALTGGIPSQGLGITVALCEKGEKKLHGRL